MEELGKERADWIEIRRMLVVEMEKGRLLYNKKMGRDPSEPWPEEFGIPVGALHCPSPESAAPTLIASSPGMKNYFFPTPEQSTLPPTENHHVHTLDSGSLSIDQASTN